MSKGSVKVNRRSKLVLTEERKKDFRQCPHTGRQIILKANRKPLRQGLEPGRIVIILSGPHAGRRAVFIKQLENGEVLVNGVFQKENRVPLTAVPQRNLLITSIKVNCNFNLNDFTYTMLCKPKDQSWSDFYVKPPQYLVDAQKKADETMTPAVKEYTKYLETPFVIRPQDKVHTFKF